MTQPTPPPTGNLHVCYRHPERRAGVSCQRCDRPICPDCMKTASVGFHCPECAKGGSQQVYTRDTIARLNRPVVTMTLIGINVVVFVLGLATRSSQTVRGANELLIDYGLIGFKVDGGEWYRIVTSGFLHFDVVHLGFNMYFLYIVGQVLEPFLERGRFLAVYATSLVFGSLGQLLVDPDALAAGASGAVYGVMGALLFAYRFRGIDPLSTGIGRILVIGLVLTLVRFSAVGGHIGGLAGGLASAWLLLEGAPTLGEKRALGAVVGLGVAAFGLSLAIA